MESRWTGHVHACMSRRDHVRGLASSRNRSAMRALHRYLSMALHLSFSRIDVDVVCTRTMLHGLCNGAYLLARGCRAVKTAQPEGMRACV